MADIGENEIDPAIAEAMGFSGFGMQQGKKRKLNSDMAFVESSTTSSEKQVKGKSMTNVDSRNSKKNTAAGDHAVVEDTLHSASADRLPNDQQDSPGAGTAVIDTATPSDLNGDDEQTLRALAYGVRNKNGDMVYFQQSFLEDPWRNLEPR